MVVPIFGPMCASPPTYRRRVAFLSLFYDFVNTKGIISGAPSCVARPHKSERKRLGSLFSLVLSATDRKANSLINLLHQVLNKRQEWKPEEQLAASKLTTFQIDHQSSKAEN
jgi:hypothetical protein